MWPAGAWRSDDARRFAIPVSSSPQRSDRAGAEEKYSAAVEAYDRAVALAPNYINAGHALAEQIWITQKNREAKGVLYVSPVLPNSLPVGLDLPGRLTNNRFPARARKPRSSLSRHPQAYPVKSNDVKSFQYIF
jgi:hypothetical protein